MEKVATGAVTEAGKRALGGAVDSITALWDRLKPKVDEVDGAKKAVERVADRPADPLVIGGLELELRELFERDPALASAVKGLLDKAQSDVQSAGGANVVLQAIGAHSVVTQGTVSNSIINTGTFTSGAAKPSTNQPT